MAATANATTKQKAKPIDSSVSPMKPKVQPKRNSTLAAEKRTNTLAERVKKQNYVLPAPNKVNTARGGERQASVAAGGGRGVGPDQGANLGRQSDDQLELPPHEVTTSFRSQAQDDVIEPRNEGSKIYNETTGAGLTGSIVQPAGGKHRADTHLSQDLAPFQSACKPKVPRRGESAVKAPDYLNQTSHTLVSKESGTNVSYQSNYSAIKSNILRFKNKKVTGTAGAPGGAKGGAQTALRQQDASDLNTSQDASKSIKVRGPVHAKGSE